VARLAGVSPATVSRVLSAKLRVDPGLADRVRGAALQLDYRPSRVARNLRARSSSIWGIIVADIGNPFFTRVVRAVQDAALESGRTVIMCNSDESVDKERRALEVLVAERVGGVLISPASEIDSDLEALLAQRIPVVAIDRRPPAAVDTVLTDNVLGGLEATRHLLTSGRRRVGCITGPRDVTTARERLDGFQQAMAEAGLAPAAVAHADFHEEGGRDALLQWIDAGSMPEAVFVANNLMTLGVLQAAGERDVRVPEDLAVVGFDELPWAGGLAARIPVVAQPAREMALAATRLLEERCDGYDGPPRSVVLAPHLLRQPSIEEWGRG